MTIAKKRGTDDDTLREWTFDDDLPDEYVMKGHKPAKQRGNVVDIETREPVKTVVNKTAYTNAFALGCRDRLRPHHAYSWSHGWRHRNNGELWTDDPEGLTLLAELSEMIGTNKKLMPSQVRGILQAHLHRPDGWDSHHHEIALPDHRIYNLDTGEVRDAQADDQHTRRLDAVPVKGPHPNWDKVLNHICRDDTEKLWLQTWCGYCLTGHVDPRHWFVFLSGPGNGGKSTLLTAITRIAGSYHRGLPADAFTGDRHLEWLARLDGARFGTILELPATAWRKIEVLKGLVAGDPMTANFMRRNSFDFKPVIKIMIAGNTRPRLPGGDSGLRRRMVNIHVPEVTTPNPISPHGSIKNSQPSPHGRCKAHGSTSPTDYPTSPTGGPKKPDSTSTTKTRWATGSTPASPSRRTDSPRQQNSAKPTRKTPDTNSDRSHRSRVRSATAASSSLASLNDTKAKPYEASPASNWSTMTSDRVTVVTVSTLVSRYTTRGRAHARETGIRKQALEPLQP